MIIASYILLLIGIYLFAKIDADHVRKGQYFEDHSTRWLIRFIFVVLAAPTFPDFLLMSAVFYLFFDIFYNLSSGKDWNYIGNTSEIDKFWQKYQSAQIPFKIILIIITITIKIIVT